MGGGALPPRPVAEEFEGQVKGSYCPVAWFPICEEVLVHVTHIWLNGTVVMTSMENWHGGHVKKRVWVMCPLPSFGQKHYMLSNKFSVKPREVTTQILGSKYESKIQWTKNSLNWLISAKGDKEIQRDEWKVQFFYISHVFFLIMKSVPLEDLPIKTRLMVRSCKKAQ